jgi:hypothetical protein
MVGGGADLFKKMAHNRKTSAIPRIIAITVARFPGR